MAQTKLKDTAHKGSPVISPEGLLAHRFSELKDLKALKDIAQNFAIRIPSYLTELIKTDDPNGAIAKQYVPDVREAIITENERIDPIGDHAHEPVKGLIHRYPDRALLKISNICAVYCRFCFRKEMIGPGNEIMSELELERALKYISANTNIWEVILTGGDPLVLSPRRIGDVMQRLAAIPHVQIIRIHTRMPSAEPGKITAGLAEALTKGHDKPVYMAVHINHPDEITRQFKNAISLLQDRGVTILSQSVLLKDVNNDPEILEDLLRKLVALKIRPYEIHHPDLTKGTGHFRLSIAEGQAIISNLRGRLSGLCQPHYMLDIPGGHGKIEITPATLVANDDDTYTLTDYRGRKHSYRDC